MHLLPKFDIKISVIYGAGFPIMGGRTGGESAPYVAVLPHMGGGTDFVLKKINANEICHFCALIKNLAPQFRRFSFFFPFLYFFF